MDESALWEKIPQGKLTVPLWYTTRVFPLWETQRAAQLPSPSFSDTVQCVTNAAAYCLESIQYTVLRVGCDNISRLEYSPKNPVRRIARQDQNGTVCKQ